MAHSIIEFRNVAKSFGENHVLDGADLSIDKGETLTIMGGSGKGKTVFLKLMLGVIAPDSGKVFFQGKDLGLMKEKELSKMRSRIGMLFQGAALFDSLSVGENVAYPLRLHFKHSEGEISRIVNEKLEMVGLPGLRR